MFRKTFLDIKPFVFFKSNWIALARCWRLRCLWNCYSNCWPFYPKGTNYSLCVLCSPVKDLESYQPCQSFVSCIFQWLWEHKRGTSTQNGLSHFSSHRVSDGSLTVHRHNIAINSFLVKSVILTRQCCHEQLTHYKALSKHISHKVPMETALTYWIRLITHGWHASWRLVKFGFIQTDFTFAILSRHKHED